MALDSHSAIEKPVSLDLPPEIRLALRNLALHIICLYIGGEKKTRDRLYSDLITMIGKQVIEDQASQFPIASKGPGSLDESPVSVLGSVLCRVLQTQVCILYAAPPISIRLHICLVGNGYCKLLEGDTGSFKII